MSGRRKPSVLGGIPIGHPFGSRGIISLLGDHSDYFSESKPHDGDPASYWADWRGMTSSLCKSICCLTTSTRPRFPFDKLSNSLSIYRKAFWWSSNLTCGWTSPADLLHIFFVILHDCLVFGNLFQTFWIGSVVYNIHGAATFRRFSARCVRETLEFIAHYFLWCMHNFRNFLVPR